MLEKTIIVKRVLGKALGSLLLATSLLSDKTLALRDINMEVGSYGVEFTTLVTKLRL